MDFSQSLPKGQFPITCQLCETGSKISWKCMDCTLLMCNRCKDRIHINIKNARNHKAVDIKDIELHTEEPDFGNIPCKEHRGQVCFMFCKSCDKLVCPPCIAKIHKGHELMEISEGYQIQVQRLKVGQNQTRINIDELTKGEYKLKEIKKTEHNKYMEAREKIQTQNTSLKKAVDQFTGKLLKELDQKWEILKMNIEKEEHRVISLKKETTDKNKHTEEVISTNDVEKMFNVTKELEKYLREAEKPLEFKFSSMPTFVPRELSQSNVGILQTTPTDITLQVIQVYTTHSSIVGLMSACVDSLWISDEDVVQKVQPEVNKLKIISNFNIEITGMAVTPSNDLLLAPCGKSVLKQNSSSTNTITDTNYSVDPLRLAAVHVTSDYKVVVGAIIFGKVFPATGRRVVISMNKGGRHRTVYEFDKNNQRMFTYPRSVTSTDTGNMCVVDRLSNDCRGRIVVLKQDGDILNIYTGHPDINTKNTPFKPLSIVTTLADKIIVTDLNNDVLHVLNNVGHLMTHINTRDIGIQWPFSIAFTTGTVYIGCSEAISSTDNAKLYHVQLTGC